MILDGSRLCLENRCIGDEPVGDRHVLLPPYYAGIVLVVTHNFAKVKLRVRFSLPAPEFPKIDEGLESQVAPPPLKRQALVLTRSMVC